MENINPLQLAGSYTEPPVGSILFVEIHLFLAFRTQSNMVSTYLIIFLSVKLTFFVIKHSFKTENLIVTFLLTPY